MRVKPISLFINQIKAAHKKKNLSHHLQTYSMSRKVSIQTDQDPKKPVHANESRPSAIVNGFSVSPHFTHIQRIRADMTVGNQTLVTEFVLVGLTDQPRLQVPVFLVFLIIYLITMLSDSGDIMEVNRTLLTEFVLRGITDRPELQIPLFLMFFSIYVITMDSHRIHRQVQEGEYPNRLDPKNPVYAEETSPSVIVNGSSERLRVSHIQRIRPHSENLVGSHARSVPVQLALVNSHWISPLVSVGGRTPRGPDFLFHFLPPSAPHLDLGGLSLVLQYSKESNDPRPSEYDIKMFKTFRTFQDSETQLLLAAPIYFKRKMGIEEGRYGLSPIQQGP
ncbi:hypothetical protein U0070_014865 [Myodes glareolus]|uniref:Uncharacterized protein n=1 Tax=Myodes glareolus TaxID=447135 RepID=A0AAW0IDX3_MYOGA